MADKQPIIFVVDDNEANLTACKQILKSHYVVYPALSAAKMFDLLKHVKPEMILLDVEMPEMDGYEAITLLKENDALREIPVLFLSAREDAASEAEGINLGAVDFIRKPFGSVLLLKRIETQLSLVHYRKLLEENNIPVT